MTATPPTTPPQSPGAPLSMEPKADLAYMARKLRENGTARSFIDGVVKIDRGAAVALADGIDALLSTAADHDRTRQSLVEVLSENDALKKLNNQALADHARLAARVAGAGGNLGWISSVLEMTEAERDRLRPALAAAEARVARLVAILRECLEREERWRAALVSASPSLESTDANKQTVQFIGRIRVALQGTPADG